MQDYEAAKAWQQLEENTRQGLEQCQKEYEQGNNSEALELLAKAVGLHQDMGPMEILEAIMALEQGKEFFLLPYSRIMSLALQGRGTLGKGMYKAWEHLEVSEALGKRYTTRKSPNAAVYPYCVIYWSVARVQAILGENCKENLKIAEGGALLDKEQPYVFLMGVAIAMERYAYTYSKIGAADVNNLKNLLLELLEEFIPEEVEAMARRLLVELDKVTALKSDIKKQRAQLLKLAAMVPLVACTRL